MDFEFNFVDDDTLQEDIKAESPDRFSLISPPTTPPSTSFLLPSVPATRPRPRGSTFSRASQRPRPYPLINPETGTMSNSSVYGTWNHSGGRHGHSKSHPNEYMNGPYLADMQDQSSDMRPISSSSSLTGAMGYANLTSSARHSRSPASSNSGHLYVGNPQNHDLGWNASPHMQPNMAVAMNTSAYPAVAGHGGLNLPFNVNQTNLEYSATRNISPESLSPNSPQYQKEFTEPYQGQMVGFPGTSAATHQYSPSPDERNSSVEVRRLQRRVRELELECSRAKSAMESLRASNPSSGLTTGSPSSAFQNSWRARTESRKKIFCSLNRAGNALCSWHDSRRERRVYPPRNAPPGYLNCGCTFEEALFEESLSRHGVGSYLPGEAVRMDPALRNPLLRLLQNRYDYKDGDFERDPLTERWAEGESPAVWEQKSHSGQLVRRRNDADRH